MKKSELKNYIKEEIISMLSEDASEELKATKELTQAVKDLGDAKEKAGLAEDQIDEMAKISGDLKSAIEKVINDNEDLSGLPLKKKIKGDSAVEAALEGDTLYDNQLNRFIKVTRGEMEVGKRGRKANPDAPKKTPKSTGSKPKSKSKDTKRDKTLSTSSLGGKKYYTRKGKDEEGPSDAELRKLAKSGGSVGKDKESKLKQQEKTKLVKAFLKDMKAKNIVDSSNKVVDKEKYDAEWKKTKPEIEAKVKSIK